MAFISGETLLKEGEVYEFVYTINVELENEAKAVSETKKYLINKLSSKGYHITKVVYNSPTRRLSVFLYHNPTTVALGSKVGKDIFTTMGEILFSLISVPFKLAFEGIKKVENELIVAPIGALVGKLMPVLIVVAIIVVVIYGLPYIAPLLRKRG